MPSLANIIESTSSYKIKMIDIERRAEFWRNIDYGFSEKQIIPFPIGTFVARFWKKRVPLLELRKRLHIWSYMYTL